jgi:hypothetical protein
MQLEERFNGEIPLFVRGTTVNALLWLFGVDRVTWPYDAQPHSMWPIKEGFESAGITPIAKIPEVCTFEKSRNEAINWAAEKHTPEEGALVYFNREIAKKGYELDHLIANSGILVAAQHTIDPNYDYKKAVVSVEALMPQGLERLKKHLPDVKVDGPIAHNPHYFTFGNHSDSDIIWLSLYLSAAIPKPITR